MHPAGAFTLRMISLSYECHAKFIIIQKIMMVCASVCEHVYQVTFWGNNFITVCCM